MPVIDHQAKNADGLFHLLLLLNARRDHLYLKPASVYSSAATPSAGPATAPHITGSVVTLQNGLKYVDIKVGKGTAAKQGSTVTVEYTGWFASTCKKFDSSYDRGGQSFPVTLGQ